MLNQKNDIIERYLHLMSGGEYEHVHKAAINMIHANVSDPIPYLLLARLCFEHKNYAKSVELFEKSMALDSHNPYTGVYFAQLLTYIGKQERARQLAQQVLEHMVQKAHLQDTLGVVFSRVGNHEAAVTHFKQAVNLAPKIAHYHYNLAVSLQFLGTFEAAEQSYKDALALDPSLYKAYSSLVGLKKQTPDTHLCEPLVRAFEAAEQDANAKLYIGHALAKTYEDLGDYPTSFKWLEKAKADKLNAPCTLDYENICQAAMNSCMPSIVQMPENITNTTTPVFIVGLPRTGTTLVDRIISSHRNAVSCGELNVFAELVKKEADTPSNLVLDAQTLQKANTLNMASIGDEYLKATVPLRNREPVFTDKMPLNFFYAGLILQALPNARVIALRRGAMDSCLSNYRQLLTTEHAYYDYTYSMDKTADFYISFDKLMSHWRNTLPSSRYMEIQYEDIIDQQEKQTRNLLEFCGLDFDDACLRFHENKAAVSTASSVQVRQPLYASSIGRWKRYKHLLDPLKNRLGSLA